MEALALHIRDMNATRTAAGSYIKATDIGCGYTRFEVSRDGVKPVVFHGRVSDKHMCGAKCRNSTGPSCTCSCGGHNHGKDRW